MAKGLKFSVSSRAAIAASLMAIAISAPAAAQDTQGEEPKSAIDSLNDPILVTATKKADVENVQDAAVAITAFNSDSLEALKVRDVQSLTFSAPNVSLDQIGTSRGQANFSIRGLGINSSIPSLDPTVGVFVDGVYLGFNGGVVFDLFDLDSVEILRGPQGVLFGRNVTGGAVLINTGNPTEEFSGKFRAAVDGPVDSGRGGANYTVSGVVSGPIVEDTLLFKLGGYYNKDEGYFRNLFDGSNHGRAETKILRGALEGRFGDLTLTGKLDYFDSEGDGPAAQNRGQFSRESFDFAINNRGSYTAETWTGSLKAELDIGPGTLTNIFGYRDFSNTTEGDIDSLPVFIFESPTATEQEQYSNELRYALSVDGLDLTVGGFWFDQSLAYDEIRNIVGRPLPVIGGGTQDHRVIGAFANAELNVTEQLSVIAGLRWSEEKKSADVVYVSSRTPCSVIDGSCPITGANADAGGLPNGFSDSDVWRNLSPKLGLQYEFATGQLYGHWTRGYRSGGYNLRNTDPDVFLNTIVPETGSLSFDEERVDSFEIGGKYQTADGSFTLNAAAYVTKVKDMQREINQPGDAGVSQYILNTADATIKGMEAEARMRVSKGLLFTANIGVIDASYDEIRFDISSPQGIDGPIDGADFALALPRVPEFTWGAGFVHDLDLGGSSLVTRVNLQYRDEFAYQDSNIGYIQDITNLDANITWNSPVDGLSLSIYGKNLFDEVQAGGDTQLPFGGGAFSNGVNRPFDPSPNAGTFSPLAKGRVVGAEITYGF